MGSFAQLGENSNLLPLLQPALIQRRNHEAVGRQRSYRVKRVALLILSTMKNSLPLLLPPHPGLRRKQHLQLLQSRRPKEASASSPLADQNYNLSSQYAKKQLQKEDPWGKHASQRLFADASAQLVTRSRCIKQSNS